MNRSEINLRKVKTPALKATEIEVGLLLNSGPKPEVKQNKGI
jgi:hypothetical protein